MRTRITRAVSLLQRRENAPFASAARRFHPVPTRLQQQHQKAPNPHGNFYKTHGRALFKALTLAFFSYQCFYWMWLTVETDTQKDQMNQTIKSLEGEVRLLEESKNSHRPGQGQGQGHE